MHLPSKLWRSMALFVPISEARPRSPYRSRGLSFFVVPEKGHVSWYEIHLVGAPKSPLFAGILRIPFTLEETNLTRAINFTLKREDRIAVDAGLGIEDARSHPDDIAQKPIIFSKEKEDSRYYSFLPPFAR